MTRTSRRGTAPLELVLVLPLLFTLMAVGWWCVRCGLTKTAAATTARRAAWEKRKDADPGTPFDLQHRPLMSSVEAKIEAVVPGKNPLSDQPVRAESFALMTDKTWDFEQSEFVKLPGFAVHLEQLLHFGQFIPFIQRYGPRVGGFAVLDLMANGAYTRHLASAAGLRVARAPTPRVFSSGKSVIDDAIELCERLMKQNPLKKKHYEELLRILKAGRIATERLSTEARR